MYFLKVTHVSVYLLFLYERMHYDTRLRMTMQTDTEKYDKKRKRKGLNQNTIDRVY